MCKFMPAGLYARCRRLDTHPPLCVKQRLGAANSAKILTNDTDYRQNNR